MPLGEFTQPLTEEAALAKLRGIAGQNRVAKSLIGQGYYGTHTPGVILRNILENPAWYTAYTPYQPEISQGRLEAMLNFQQMVIDLTAMDIANASMLDEATAAAEAMTLLQRVGKHQSNVFFVADDVLPQTLEVVRTRAEPIGANVVTGPAADAAKHNAFGVLLQYPGANGALLGDLNTYQALTDAVHAAGGLVVAAADLLALTLLSSQPGARRMYSARAATMSSSSSISNNVFFFSRERRMASRSGMCASRLKPTVLQYLSTSSVSRERLAMQPARRTP